MRGSVRILTLAALIMLLISLFSLYSPPVSRPHFLNKPFEYLREQISSSQGSGSEDQQLPLDDGQDVPGLQGSTSNTDNVPQDAVQDGLDAVSEPSNSQVEKEDKVIVVGRLTSQDTSWVVDELPEWQHAIYVVDNVTAELHTSINKGREALPYLTYIVDNYHNLPSTIAFVHAHKDGFPDAWHNDNKDYSNVMSLKALQIPFVQKNGYVNLRCNPAIGCPAEVTLNRTEIDWGRNIEVNMPGVWSELFGTKHPDIIATPCCAQFAVSRDQVQRRPLADYQKYLNWLLETKLDDELSGRMLEYLWHVIFGKEPVYCPDLMTCYCEVYGWCNIDELPAPGTGTGA